MEWARRTIGAKSRRGIDGFLGIVVTEMEPGRLVAEMEVTPELITMMGTMHGGCLSALCDHVLGVVMYPVMAPGCWAATTEFKLNLLAPVTKGVCRATSEIIAMSKRLLELGVFVIGFGYPVVPEGHARLRVQISAGHETSHIDGLVDALKRL